MLVGSKQEYENFDTWLAVFITGRPEYWMQI